MKQLLLTLTVFFGALLSFNTAEARTYHHNHYRNVTYHYHYGHYYKRTQYRHYTHYGRYRRRFSQTAYYQFRREPHEYGARFHYDYERQRHYTRYARAYPRRRYAGYSYSRRRYARYGYQPRRRYAQYEGYSSRRGVGARPRAWCGWFMRTIFGGGAEYNLAANWAHRGRPTSPHAGAVVVFPHHVGVIVGPCGNGRCVVKSGNWNNRVATVSMSIRNAIAFRAM